MTATSQGSLTLIVNNTMPMQAAYDLIEKHYRENQKKLVQRYSRFLNSKERAEDVVQEGYLRCLTYWNTCPDNEKEFAKWFTTVVGNCLKDNHRAEIMKGAVMYNEEDDQIIDAAAIPAIIYKQVVERINNKPDSHRNILSLALIHQYRPADIEAVVLENAANIRKIVSRFRKEIKEEFGWNI